MHHTPLCEKRVREKYWEEGEKGYRYKYRVKKVLVCSNLTVEQYGQPWGKIIIFLPKVKVQVARRDRDPNIQKSLLIGD